MTEEPKNEPLIEDPFIAYWEQHEVQSKEFPPEVVEEFRNFAVNVWNAARYDMAIRYSDLLLSVSTMREGESRHDAAKRMILSCEVLKITERSRHERLAGKSALVDAIIGGGFKSLKFAAEMQSKGLAKFTGNQHSDEWKWKQAKLDMLSEYDLSLIYEASKRESLASVAKN